MRILNHKIERIDILSFLFGLVGVTYLALVLAPVITDAFSTTAQRMLEVDFFKIVWCENSLKTITAFVLIYALGGIYVLVGKKNKRDGEEYGSAQWADVEALCRKYKAKEYTDNRLLTQNMRMSYDSFKHKRTLNTMIIGGTGAQKTRGYTMPNVLNAVTSIVITDPNGEVLVSCGDMYKRKGIDIQVLDLYMFERSMKYNPFYYIRQDKDVLILMTNYIANTTPKNSINNDPFWEKAERRLLIALALYLKYYAPPSEQNFPMIADMLREMDAQNSAISVIDILFSEIPADHIANRFYEGFKLSQSKTTSSIITTTISRMEIFELDIIREIMSGNEIDIEALGKKKSAIFCIIPDNDSTFNAVIGMLYTQIFEVLYADAYVQPDKRLKVPVHLLMEEAGNIAMPSNFTADMSTIRKRNITASLVFQDISQGKAAYKDLWEAIIANCDQILYLGGHSLETHEYISKRLGKETIDIETHSQNKGRNGSYTTSYQKIGRDLMTADEVAAMDNDYAILFMRGEHPVYDRKYELTTHPKYHMMSYAAGEAFDYVKYVDEKRAAKVHSFDKKLYTQEQIKEMSKTLDKYNFPD